MQTNPLSGLKNLITQTIAAAAQQQNPRIDSVVSVKPEPRVGTVNAALHNPDAQTTLSLAGGGECIYEVDSSCSKCGDGVKVKCSGNHPKGGPHHINPKPRCSFCG